MFSKLMNRFYYGKSGKSDYTQADLPKNRIELFFLTLRTRFGSLMLLNLAYMIFYLPAFIVLLGAFSTWTNALYSFSGTAKEMSKDAMLTLSNQFSDFQNGLIFTTLLKLIPCIFITGIANVGVAYDLRNWARDEHAFMWSDLWDSIKENWKQGLGISAINSIMPILMFIGFRFYSNLAKNNMIMFIPQLVLIMFGLVWYISLGSFNFLIVTYKLKFFDVIRNGILLSVARFPQCIVIKILNLLPILISIMLCYYVNLQVGLFIFIIYYAVIGLCLSRFVNASFANYCFEKLINPNIKGARSNIGLRDKEYDEVDKELKNSEDDDNSVYIDINKEK